MAIDRQQMVRHRNQNPSTRQSRGTACLFSNYILRQENDYRRETGRVGL